jgi:hypothetical protein
LTRTRLPTPVTVKECKLLLGNEGGGEQWGTAEELKELCGFFDQLIFQKPPTCIDYLVSDHWMKKTADWYAPPFAQIINISQLFEESRNNCRGIKELGVGKEIEHILERDVTQNHRKNTMVGVAPEKLREEEESCEQVLQAVVRPADSDPLDQRHHDPIGITDMRRCPAQQ